MRAITTIELKHKLDTEQGFYLLDVREPEEYEEGHIPGALLIPWHGIEEKIKGIKPETELITYCRTGVRASKAAKLLEQLGYSNIAVYREGWEGWHA